MVTDLEPFEHDDDDNVEPEQEHEPEPEPVNWICKTCTLMNEAKKNFCTACGAQNSTPASNIANSNTKKKIDWKCKICTCLNKPLINFCIACNAKRPDDYEIPKDYVPTDPEEIRILEKIKEDEELFKKFLVSLF